MRIAAPVIRSVYRTLIRHSRNLDNSEWDIQSEIRKQFKRFKKSGRIGHVRAAYNLEEQLRKVFNGSLTLEQVRENFKGKSEPTIQNNAHGRHNTWLKQPERRFDNYNYPPEGQVLEKTHRAAGLANLRAGYIQKAGSRKLNIFWGNKQLDMGVIDTVFAPAWTAARSKKILERKAKREEAPRRVSIVTITRASKTLAVLRVTGRRQRLKGFKKHMNRLMLDFDAKLQRVNEKIQLAKTQAKKEYNDPDRKSDQSLADLEKAWTAPLLDAKQNLLVRRKELDSSLEIHHRILLRRMKELQNLWNTRHKQTRNKILQTSKQPRPSKRLWTL